MKKEKPNLKSQIKSILSQVHPSEAIEIIESVGKELRRKNSARISRGLPHIPLDLERPDLDSLK